MAASAGRTLSPTAIRNLKAITPDVLLQERPDALEADWKVAVHRWLAAWGVVDAEPDGGAYLQGFASTRLPAAGADGGTCQMAVTAWFLVDDVKRQTLGGERAALDRMIGTIENPRRVPEVHLAYRMLRLEKQATVFKGGTAGGRTPGLLNNLDVQKGAELARKIIDLHNELQPLRDDLADILERSMHPTALSKVLEKSAGREEMLMAWYMHNLGAPAAHVAAVLGKLANGRVPVDPSHPRGHQLCHTLEQAIHQIHCEISDATQD